MKTVLCFGDSITWGFNPKDGTRFDFEQRWPGILENQMDGQIRVVEEALPGRTITSDSPYMPSRNGSKVLDMLLEAHAPIDIVIIMLGTNDLWLGFDYSASKIATDCLSLVWTVQGSRCSPINEAPEILLISPPTLGKLSAYNELFFKGRESVSKELAELYKTGAETLGIKYLDASMHATASGVDGVHLEPDQQAKLAGAIKKTVSEML